MLLARLEIPARPEFVSLARLVASSLADDRYELSDDQVDCLKLALSEACVMAIAAWGDESEENVIIECSGFADHFDMAVEGPVGAFSETDQVVQWDDEQTGSFDDEQTGSLERELGFPLIGSLVDKVVIEPTADVRKSRLVFTLLSNRAEEL